MPARRTLLTTAVALAAIAAATASAQAALPTPASKSIAPGKRIGGVRIGQLSTASRNIWGGGGRCGSSSCTFTKNSTLANDRDGRASFQWDRNGAVTYIAIEAPERSSASRKPTFTGPLTKFKTSKKIHLGSSLRSLKKAYDITKAGRGVYQIVAGINEPKTQFRIYRNRVSDIYITVFA